MKNQTKTHPDHIVKFYALTIQATKNETILKILKKKQEQEAHKNAIKKSNADAITIILSTLALALYAQLTTLSVTYISQLYSQVLLTLTYSRTKTNIEREPINKNLADQQPCCIFTYIILLGFLAATTVKAHTHFNPPKTAKLKININNIISAIQESGHKVTFPIQCDISLSDTTTQPVCIQRKTINGWQTISGTYEENELRTWLFKKNNHGEQRIPTTNEAYCKSKFRITSCVKTHPEASTYLEELLSKLTKTSTETLAP